jgi:multiple sugar transport system substrate-binding protein
MPQGPRRGLRKALGGVNVRTVWVVILIAGLLLALPGVGAGQAPVTIKYWQYFFESKVTLMDQLIKQFEAANPEIKVLHEHFPYDTYNQKVATAIPANQGPDLINLFYGWVPLYVDSGYLQPLPADAFPPAAIEREFVPMVRNSRFDGKYWALPTAVRSLALFYHEDLFRGAGVVRAPVTWDEFLAAAERTTQRDASGRITVEGFGIAPAGQDHHLIREVLFRQFGAAPYSADGRRVTYATQAGVEAFTWYTNLITRTKVGVIDFFPGASGYRNAFMAGRAAMIVDGSFAIGGIRRGTRGAWGVVPLPRRSVGGEPSNFGSYWVHGLTVQAKGPKQAAAIKFLKFITSEAVQRRWLEVVGELPASRTLVGDARLAADPIFGPFIQGLSYSRATFFIDESAQRQVIIDAINEVVVNNKSPKQALEEAAAKEQKLLDEFWTKRAKKP